MLDRRSFIRLSGAVLAAPMALADTPRPINTLGSRERIAIRGYDPVAYFRDGGPRLGKPEFSVSHGSAPMAPRAAIWSRSSRKPGRSSMAGSI